MLLQTLVDREMLLCDSVAELIDFVLPHVERTVAALGAKRASECHAVPDLADGVNRSWLGREFADWRAVAAACVETWDEGMQRYDEMTRQLGEVALAKPMARRRRSRFSEDDGDEIDCDRLRSGQPYWRTMSKQAVAAPAVATIAIELTATCRVDHQDILWRGVAGIALANLLEAAGYSVELWAVRNGTTCFANGAGLFAAVRLKAAGEPLNVESVIAGVSAWFYRTLMFAAALAIGKETGNLPTGAGVRPTSAAEMVRQQIAADACVIADCFSLASAAAQVKSLIAKFQTPKGV